jgi:hypothetical protein
MRRLAIAGSLALLVAVDAAGQTQTRRPSTRKPPPPPALTKVAPEMICPTPLGEGVRTGTAYCDVLSGRDPAGGIVIILPPHRGPVTLSFDLHNRHTYSEEQVKQNRAYARYTAVIGALAMDNTLISRAAVMSEFRTAADLVERIGGGAGPAGVKAVAPTGTEQVVITIPEEEEKVSVLGEKLIVERADGAAATYATAGRPVAVISNVMIEYRPAPAPKPSPARKPAR